MVDQHQHSIDELDQPHDEQESDVELLEEDELEDDIIHHNKVLQLFRLVLPSAVLDKTLNKKKEKKHTKFLIV